MHSNGVNILNLGCGTKTSSRPDVVNIDWSIYLRLKRSVVLRHVAPFFLRGERLERFQGIPENILVYNLRNGIPFATESVCVVYHSHVLEHLERSAAVQFMSEVRRVLVKGGIHRVVVPDLETLAREYLNHLDLCGHQPSHGITHDDFIGAMLEQCVRTEGAGTRQQPAFQRWLENRFLGDAKSRGETHQWMYDRVSLAVLLVNTGFMNPVIHTHNTSSIPAWHTYGLDLDNEGRPHKRRSLYMEAVKP